MAKTWTDVHICYRIVASVGTNLMLALTAGNWRIGSINFSAGEKNRSDLSHADSEAMCWSSGR